MAPEHRQAWVTVDPEPQSGRLPGDNMPPSIDSTHEELANLVLKLLRRISELEAAEVERRRAEDALKDDLQSLARRLRIPS
ncbi:MAG: hypothetical protein SVP26_11470 [Chloroflexota bacterium]|nr:hypothetical protein [Chloroflexota bacterium]